MPLKYFLIDWNDGKSSVLPMSTITKPQRPVDCYSVGDEVNAKLTGYGSPLGTIAAIDGMCVNY